MGDWTRDGDNYNWGWGEIYLTARDMAKFGELYLNDGVYEGNQIISAGWVRDSLRSYSEKPWTRLEFRPFTNLGYGYQWWTADVGAHQVNFAWGHGGQLIVLLDELDMVIVTTADPLNGIPAGDKPWKLEKPIIVTVGKFIDSLPAE